MRAYQLDKWIIGSCLAVAVVVSPACAHGDGPASLVQDINRAGRGSNPRQFTWLNGTLFFTADDGAGEALWRSDGTEAGTTLVLRQPVAPLATTQSALYFFTREFECGLSRTDGTADGTVMVRSDLCPLDALGIGDTLFFVDAQLWATDGSAAGTRALTSPSGGFPPNSLTPMNGRLFFVNSDVAGGAELWTSDGTPSGTTRVKALTRGPPAPPAMIAVGGTLFIAVLGGAGAGLWISDGTEIGTVRVHPIIPNVGGGGYRNSQAGEWAAVGSTLFFPGYDSTTGVELWKSDGTTAGTVLVKDLNPDGNGVPSYLSPVGPTLYFVAFNHQTGAELWKSDGTEVGTVLVKDIHPGPEGSFPRGLVNAGGTLFFTADDGRNGDQLWRSDGSESGTQVVKNISPDPYNIVSVAAVLLLPAKDVDDGLELWRSDGTEAGTVRVKDINRGPDSSHPASLTDVGGTLFFAASDSATGRELWRSDGTAAGTRLVKDIRPGFGDSSPNDFVSFNGRLLFSAGDGLTRRLWSSDGTDEGTVPLTDPLMHLEEPLTFCIFRNGECAPAPTHALTIVGPVAFFVVRDVQTGGFELDRSDGTAAGTMLLKDIAPGGARPDGARDIEPFALLPPSELTRVGDTLFFVANDGAHRAVLWRSNGTAAGTTIVSRRAVNPFGLTDINGTLFFFATDTDGSARVSTGLWKSDGSEPRTVFVVAFGPGAEESLGPLTNVSGTLFFSAPDPTFGQELWKSNGTSAGTMLVKDILPGPQGSQPGLLTPAGDTLFFTARVDPHGTSNLWKSDGTALGTTPVGDDLSAYSLATVGGTLVFGGDDDSHGRELWKSDGADAATVMMQDIAAGPGSSAPTFFTVSGDRVFFSADDGVHGRELWEMPRAAIAPACAADCNDDGRVTIDELLTLVNIALGTDGVARCGSADIDVDDRITVEEILAAVNISLDGCPRS